ncbi:MAG: FG-GAP repeat protein [Myxococcota bacterium]
MGRRELQAALVMTAALVAGCEDTPGGFEPGESELCAVNERVLEGACVACPAGSANAAGDDATGPDTMCESDACSVVLGVSCERFEEAYLKASNTNEADFFGDSVALDGDTLAVGASSEDSDATGVNRDQANNDATGSGAVYVFTRSGTMWRQEAYLKASNTDGPDLFGSSVALDGDTLAVGASWEDSAATGVNGDQANNDARRSGAVYVFTRSGTMWRQEAYLKASNTDEDDRFGLSVALDGDTLVVGAPSEASAATGVNGDQANNDATGSGAVYVFARSGTTWRQEAYLKASNTDEDDQFGLSVAVEGDTLAVGANWEASTASGVNGDQANNDAFISGAVYVFTRSGTTWRQEAYLKASNTDADDQFGWSVALDGDTLAVGALGESSTATGVNGDQANNDSFRSGAVYVFTRSGTMWRQEADLKASNTDEDDRFGSSVALDGDVLAVGARGESSAATDVNGDQANNEALQSGAVYIFTRSGTTWRQAAYLKASNTDEGDFFGGTVALDGDTLAVGTNGESSAATGVNGDQDNNAAQFSGAVYVRRVRP